jgi:hypothetical protein
MNTISFYTKAPSKTKFVKGGLYINREGVDTIVICTSSDEMHATVFYGTVLYNQGKNDSLGTNKVFEKVNYREFTGAVTLEMK